MIVQERTNKNLVIPSALGNFGNNGGGGGITPEEAAAISSAVTEAYIEEYDTEIQVDFEDLREELSGATSGLTELSGSTSAIAENISTLSGSTAANVQNIETLSGATRANTENIAALSGATTANTQNIQTLSGATETLAGQVNNQFHSIEALSGVTSALTLDLAELSGATAGKQDALTAGNGISITNDTVSVKAGEGLGFSGDTLVVSGSSSNTKVVFLNKLNLQERLDLYNELSALYDYQANGWSSAYTEDMYAFYLDLREMADQSAANTIDKFEGFFPMECVRMHPSDYGGAAFFTGVQGNRVGNGWLLDMRYVINYEGLVDGPSCWENGPSANPEYARWLYITSAGTMANDQDWSSIADDDKDGIIRMRYNYSTGGEEGTTFGCLKWLRRFKISYNDEQKWYYVWSADVLIDDTVYTGVWGMIQDHWYSGQQDSPQLLSWTSGATITLPYSPLP